MTTTISRSTDDDTISPWFVQSIESGDDPQTVEHPILGRSDLDFTLRPALLPAGTLRLMFEDQAAAEAARVFHRPAAVFSIVSDEATVPASYVTRGRVQPSQYQSSSDRWVLEVGFREV